MSHDHRTCLPKKAKVKPRKTQVPGWHLGLQCQGSPQLIASPNDASERDHAPWHGFFGRRQGSPQLIASLGGDASEGGHAPWFHYSGTLKTGFHPTNISSIISGADGIVVCFGQVTRNYWRLGYGDYAPYPSRTNKTCPNTGITLRIRVARQPWLGVG